ncbi:MAG: hypothetical protein ACT4OK_07295 [Gemmobacter sp.]
MSEPMTSGEIEDVLSSIRKLVSEDLRPLPRGTSPVASLPDADKLILTPALRVVEGQTEALATQAASDGVADQPAADPARRLRLDTVVASVAAQVSPPEGGWEAETGDVTVTRLMRTMPPRPLSADAFPDVAAEDDTGEGRGVTGAETVAADPAAGLHFARQAQRAGRGELDDDGDDAPDAAPTGTAATAQGPLADIDVQALADLVRDILRDELQGALGERMTRNIRKLVRAEVARIAAARDLA